MDVPAMMLLFNLYRAEAAMLLGEVTVRPLAKHLFGNYHAWVEGAKIFIRYSRTNIRPLLLTQHIL